MHCSHLFHCRGNPHLNRSHYITQEAIFEVYKSQFDFSVRVHGARNSPSSLLSAMFDRTEGVITVPAKPATGSPDLTNGNWGLTEPRLDTISLSCGGG